MVLNTDFSGERYGVSGSCQFLGLIGRKLYSPYRIMSQE